MNLTEASFLPNNHELPAAGEATWQSPSNIALVKYWGKHGNQLPKNPSISFTLSAATTKTRVKWAPKQSDAAKHRFFFEGEENPKFGEKSFAFFNKIADFAPWLAGLDLEIHTENTFPHSSGIASSASGMSALALCVMSMEKSLNPEMSEADFKRKASFLARIGSGSAARSLYGGLVQWGALEGTQGSDLLGTPYEFPVADVFTSYRDTILLVDKGQKQVSSTVGHGLLNGHPFGEIRFEEARKNMNAIQPILAQGDVEAFMKLVESEALMLHALMMTSDPYFILMKPNTLAILEKIWAFRAETGIPVCFTLDAGANVHVLYPEANEQSVNQFVETELIGHCQNKQYLRDQVGGGPERK